MTQRIIVLNPVEPALLSLRSALGVPLDLDLTFLSQAKTPIDPTPLIPQLALLPRSSRQVFAYDVAISSPAQGTGTVQVPGSALTDRNGYNLELYQRRTADNPADPPVPVRMIGKGVLRLEGDAYMQMGPLGMISVPTVTGPPGPPGSPGQPGLPGDPGEPGLRGSRWTTGTGDPVVVLDLVPGDMYLDISNGNVWRWDGVVWTATAP